MNKWDKYLKHRESTYTDYDELKKLLKGKILDLGCGNGQNIERLLKFFPGKKLKMFGCDPAAKTIAGMRKRFKQVEFKTCAAEKLEYPDNYFDVVYSIDVIEHVKKPELMIAEIKRVLKRSGSLFIQTPNYPIKRLYDYIYNYYDRNIFKDDKTHISKLNYFKYKNILEKEFDRVRIFSRNLIGESKFCFMKKLRISLFGKLFGQKLIAVCKKN